MSFRNKVKLKFSPQVSRPQASIKGKETAKPTFVSSLSSLIPAKEVNEISKYFKNSFSNITLDTLKIKESFPHL